MSAMSENKWFEKIHVPSDNFLPELKASCGICCVFCGHPICYIVNVKKRLTREQRLPEDIILLCPEHYEKWIKSTHKTTALQKFRQSSTPCLEIEGTDLPFQIKAFETVSLKMGHFVQSWTQDGLTKLIKPLITIDEVIVFGIKVFRAQLLVTLSLFDKYNNRLLIVRDSLIEHAAANVRILFLKNMLTILKNNEVIFALHYHYPNKLELKTGKFMLNGVGVSVNNNMIHVDEKPVKSVDKKNGQDFSLIHIGVAEKKPRSIIYLPNVDRYKK